MFSNADLEWLQKFHPELQTDEKQEVIFGSLVFRMAKIGNDFMIDPTYEELADKSREVTYYGGSIDIEIIWRQGELYPRVKDAKQAIYRWAAERRLNNLDVHLYQDCRTMCIAAPMRLMLDYKDGFELKRFFENYLIPYLFAQEHFKQVGEWIWGELEHGVLGLVEWLGGEDASNDEVVYLTWSEIQKQKPESKLHKMLSKKPRSHKYCPCGSLRKIGECHPEILRGHARLYHYYKREKIKMARK